MKKFIATILTVTVLLTSSAGILAENGKSNKISSEGTKERTQTILQNGEDNMKKSGEAFDALKKKIEEKRMQIEAKKAAFQTKREEFDAFKDILSAKRTEMIALRNTGNMLHAASAKLMGDLRSSLESISEKGLVLPDDTKLALQKMIAQVKELKIKIRETKGQIHDILKNNKEYKETRDYVSMETAFDEIFAIEQFRNDSLTQINQLLKDMIQLLVAVV